MRRRFLGAALLIAAFVFALTPTPRAQISASFEPLGLGPAGTPSVFSRALDASADGSVVIGEYFVQDGPFFIRHGFRWTAATGMQDIGALNPNAPETEALAVSADGSMIVGWSRGMSGSIRPFLWTATGMRELVEVPGSEAKATGISNDGRTIAGHFLGGSYQAYRWRDGVVTPLGTLPGEFDSFGRAVCGAGDAVVGSTHSAGGRAFRWTEASGMQELPSLRPGAYAYPQACSDDGTVVVGSGSDGEGKGQPPIRWDPKDGVRSLGTLGGDSGEAHAVSADGTVVAGAAGLPFVNGVSDFAAFRWTTATRKIEQLSKVLESRGVTTPFCHDPSTCPAGTWFVWLAAGISADGKVIVGEAINPDNRQEAYRAVVP